MTQEIRHALWEDAGVIRNAAGLEHLLASPALLPRLVAESALARRESRGGHFRSDFPTEDAAFEAPRRPAPRPRARAGAMELTAEALDRVVRTALAEDVGTGDRTTDGVVPAEARCTAELLLEEAGVACGIDAARAVFEALDPERALRGGARRRHAP